MFGEGIGEMIKIGQVCKLINTLGRLK